MRTHDITGDSYSLKDLFDGAITYDIDYYQREYAWSEQDVRVLIDDLHREYEAYSKHRGPKRLSRQPPPYFLGPFVFYEDGNGRRFLVDGQQRFTTLHLIFIIIRRLLDGLGAKQSAEMLNRAIMTYDDQGRRVYRITIDERTPALDAFYQGKPFEPPRNSTLSVRNLVTRGRDLEEMLDRQFDAETRPHFANWLLNHVVMVGIRAISADNAYRIFETMNDRGARLTPVDLLKSFLLSHAESDEVILNQRWRHMLGELTATRDDHDAPARFIKSALIAKFAGSGTTIESDAEEIDRALNVWVKRHRKTLGLNDGQQFFQFVDQLIDLATRYRTFLAATRQLDRFHDLEGIFYNEANGMASQMIPILAAVNYDDSPPIIKEKASRIANFIDRWYVLRVVDDLSVQQRDLDELVRKLLIPLRACDTADDVTEVLNREKAEEDPPFSVFATFGLRGNNTHQVRYLLARITAFVAVSLGKANEIEGYLGSDRFWQIEHIFADHAERHPEISGPMVFRALRNRLGVLVLLPRRDNNSLNDLPYVDKVKTYSRQNDLAAILNADHRSHNPDLRDFIKRNRIEGLFRSFNERDKIEKIAGVRQELYLYLCRQIWDPVRLHLGDPSAVNYARVSPLPEDQPQLAAKAKARARKKVLNSHVGKLIRVGLIQPGEKLVGAHGGDDYWASVDDDGAIVLSVTGVRYTRIDEAAREIRQRATKGTEFWHKEDPGGGRTSIKHLLGTIG